MALTVYTATDTSAQCGSILACGSGAVAGTNGNSEIDVGGTAGSSEQTVTIGSSQTLYGFFFQLPVGEPNKTTYEAGDFVIRFEVTNTVMDVTWSGASVCRLNSSCVNQATIVQDLGLSASMNTSGVHSATLNLGSDHSASASDKIYIALRFTNSNSMFERSFGITPSQDIDTPLDTSGAGGGIVYSMAASGGLAGLGGMAGQGGGLAG